MSDTPPPKTDPVPAPDVAAPAPAKPKKRLGMIVLPVLFVAGIIFLKLSFIFFFVGMLPAIVAYMVDKDKYKYIFSTVTALNLAGVFPHMMDIFIQGGNMEAVNTKLSDAFVWLEMYGAASMGWALVHVSPIIATLMLEGVYRGRIAHMEHLQHKLEEEWGDEIKQEAGK